MNEHEQKMWLLLDNIIRMLKRAKYWTTSVDDYHQDLLMALSLLEAALEKIEKEEK